ncbi:sensor histidine kinase [Dysosmobacter sp.]|uniref:sensor histidine kinase n=1 Tax=Dysosmobacter sp. TaxID=2591382 RepID=UPI002A8D7625|nr:ATP-binding protein [Dysosmobacter sp.]MDY3281868.1 ATP-binding protein [Dysosmobacter sp.]
MTKRIFQAIVSVSVSALVLCLLLTVGVLHGYFEDQVTRELENQAACIARGLTREGAASLEGGLPAGTRVTWVAADGTVLYDNWEDPERMDNHAGREEIRQAAERGSGRAARYSDTLSEKTLYYALRLSDGTVLRVAERESSAWALLARALTPVVLSALAVCLLAGFMASRAARQIVRPLNELDLAEPWREVEYDELAPLMARMRSQNRLIQQQMSQLSRRQEEFTAITENMSEGFLVLDNRARVLSHNGAALRLLGAEGTEATPEVSAYVLNREAPFRRAVEEALAGRRSEQLLERDGCCRRILASPVFQDGHLNGAVLVILDTTEKEQRETLRREFTANVSHELRTPLTAILGTAEILQNGLVRPEDVPHFAGNIHREAGRLIELVNDIIKLSRLDEGGPNADWRMCGLYATAQAVLEQVRPAAEQKHVSLRLKGCETEVWAVPQILEEIVYNLCENAVKYNREGGSVTVTAERRDGGARLTVSDTGMGIPPEARQRVFERFYRVDKSHPTGGTGLGLSIVKHGAAYLGGTVELRSEVGKGSDFILTLPEKADGRPDRRETEEA